MRKTVFSLCFTLLTTLSFAFEKDFGHLSISDGLSQMSVVSIAQDTDGYMWFGTRDGLNRYDGKEFKIFRNDIEDTLSISDNYIKVLIKDPKGGLWIGTAGGLNYYDNISESFTRFFINPGQRTGNINEINSLCLLEENLLIGTYRGLYILRDNLIEKFPEFDNRVYSTIEKDGEVYIGHTAGLSVLTKEMNIKTLIEGESVNHIYISKAGNLYVTYADYGDFAKVDMHTGKTQRFHLFGQQGRSGQPLIRCITESTDGRSLIFGTYDGLRIYELDSGKITSINQGNEFGHGLSHYAVESIYSDRAGTLWVGTYGGGINHAHDVSPLFRHYAANTDEIQSGVLSSITTSPDGKTLWIGTDAAGVVGFDVEKETFHTYPKYSDDMYKDNNVKSLLYDEGMLYAGFYTGKLGVFDTKSGEWSKIIKDDNNSAIYSIIKNNGQIILGRYSQYGLKKIKGDRIVNMGLSTEDGNIVNVSQITTLCYDRDTLWIGTRSKGLYRYVPNGRLDHFSIDGSLSISGNRISTVVRDSKGRIFVGTSDGGLNIWKNGCFTCISHKDGLADNSICSVQEDYQKRIWVITRSGISLLGEEDRAVRTFNHSDGILTHEFSPNSCTITPEGHIWIGGDNALLKFMPENMNINGYIPPVVINSVTVNGKHVSNGKTLGLVLNHRENSLTFRFSSLNYMYPEKNRYSYFLSGADNQWQEAGAINMVNYTNLSPGTYEFMVKGSNNDGVWNPEPAVFRFEILKPVWTRWWALCIYLLAICIIAFIIFKSVSDKRKMHRSMMEKQRNEEQYKARIRLFTNFAHELRTPLTLIISPLEEILSIDNPQPVTHSTLHLIHDNAKRLLHMVNQLMDLRSKEEDKMKVRVAEGDISGFAKEIFIAFNHQAQQRGISYEFVCREKPSGVWFDRNLFEKVLMNLLSNAFKFTPDGGKISLDISEKDDTVTLKVSDSGIGISECDLENIFNPFYRTDDAHDGFEGSGVGLSLVKSIIELHHGDIYAESAKGRGTTFYIVLHKGNDRFGESEIIQGYQDSETIDRYAAGEEEIEYIPAAAKSSTTILVVEDNKELRKYIVSGLSRFYNVIEASNGSEGRLQALANAPSLIISDVMMPVMDGLKMCEELKNDSRTSHIPIILLTARQMVIQMKEGLELGADDYITKPFNMQSLILKVGNIISSREKLKVLYGQTVAVENLGLEINAAISDEKFLQQLNAHIDQYISDSDLNADALCRIVGMSRATLYRKVVAATGLSPARYIQTVRLNMAAKMLENSDMSVTDIAIATGFSSIVHFSSSFKKKYGVSPTQYVHEKSQEQKNEHID